MQSTVLTICRLALATFGTRMFIYHQNRLPLSGPILVVSNHRSFMDPMLLTVALGRPIRFVCHHYMSQVPVLRELVAAVGAFPLEKPQKRHRDFLHRAIGLLQSQEVVGIFPEGAAPMLNFTQPHHVSKFERGFAHLALRADVSDLVVLPITIASTSEKFISSGVPLEALRLFDPSEPLFEQPGAHPLLIYEKVNIGIGRPYWINGKIRQQYQGKQVKLIVNDLIDHCRSEIQSFLTIHS